MGQAAMLWAARDELAGAAAAVERAIPHHWTGRAALRFQRTSFQLSAGLSAAAGTAGDAAALARQHELESAAVQTALATGAAVAV